MYVATEALLYQGKVLHSKITESVRFLRTEGSYSTKAIGESLIDEHIRIQTGLKVKFAIINDRSMGHNAAVYFPYLTLDHPFVKFFHDNSMKAPRTVGGHLLRIKKNPVHGKVDLDKGMVSGLYSEILSDIMMDLTLIKDFNFTPEEVAAIVLHELGHIFTYYQFLDQMTFGGLVTLIAAREMAGIEDKQQKEYVLKLAEDIMGIDVEDADKIIDNPEDAHVILFREYVTQKQSSTTYGLYDLRNVEQLADQFCVKHGAGKYQASALYKLYRLDYNSATLTPMMHILKNATAMIPYIVIQCYQPFILGTFPVVIGMNVLIATMWYLLFNMPGLKIYDSPEARVKYLKMMMIDNLKKAKDGETKALITAEIESVDEQLKLLDDKRSLATLFWESVPSIFRTAKEQERAAKELEALLFNDLYYQSSRFTTLVSKP